MRRPFLLLLLLVVLVIAACGNPAIDAVPTTTTTPLATTTLPGPAPEPEAAAPDGPVVYRGLSAETLSDGMTLVAMMTSETDVYDNPTPGGELLVTLPETTILGTETVLVILEGPFDGWAKVMLPMRPNGSEGWVQTDNARIYVVEGQVVVDLSERVLTYYLDGEEVLTTEIAVGTSRNPTPVGEYFVTDNVTLANPNSPWGPHALGLSARSETITEYNGGDGIIGIHGTNKPGSIGNAASLGCVRLPNDVITQLHEMIPIGTPVVINA